MVRGDGVWLCVCVCVDMVVSQQTSAEVERDSLLKLNVGMGVKRRSELDARRKAKRKKARNRG